MTTAKPEWLEELQSSIFERLPSPAEKEAWTQDLDSAIPSGLPEKALTRIRDRFLYDLLVQKVQPLVPEDKKYTATRDAISGVVDLLNRSINGETINNQQWRQAEKAALADAGVAAWSAAWSAWSALSAAESAAWDAAAAAESAARAADARAARAAATFWHWAAEWLLAIIREEVAAWEAARKPA